MKFLDAEFVQGFIRMANVGMGAGMAERNGGNLSYRVKPEGADSVRENFNPGPWAAHRHLSAWTGWRVFSCNRKWKIFQKRYH